MPKLAQPINTEILKYSKEGVHGDNEGCHQGKPTDQAATMKLHRRGFILTNLLWSTIWCSALPIKKFEFVSVLVFISLMLRKIPSNWHMQPECLSIHLQHELLLLGRLDSHILGHTLHRQAT